MLTTGNYSNPNDDGEIQQPNKRRRVAQSNEITLDDTEPSLRLFFLLLDGSAPALAAYIPEDLRAIITLADKYDAKSSLRLLAQSIWEACSGVTYRPSWRACLYGIAFHMRHETLARYIVSRMNNGAPIRWGWATIEPNVGAHAWHCLVRAADGCEPFSWPEVAKRLEFPLESVSRHTSSVASTIPDD